ncbi:MAG: MG2 domain-containing protein, partial [Pirellulaceae bacterium]|nr:MG2 domain-containing protein [Pirellulaceae bacterium]
MQNIGWQLINGNQAKYVKERTAQWRVKLDPADVHWDRRRTVTTPLEDSGAYLVTAKMRDGNTSRAVLWLNDTAIVRKPLHKKNLYFVADASNGKPIADANMEFFGYRVRRVGNAKQQVDSTNFARKTDHLGRVMLESDKERTAYQWMVVARTKQGRFAYLGFHGVWVQNYYDQEYNQAKGFIITDRPVYRPEQKVKFKGWLRHAKYDQEGSSFANQNQQIEILDPKGKSVYKKTLKTDAYGGVDGEFDVPGDATLGVYSVRLVAVGMTTTFRIEEYKKPEFEVTIESPEKPVMLGEKIEARVNARYYFGAPVTNATAKIKVMRHEHTAQWYPYGPWDWCFGPGYWWYAYDYPWYPGWEKWVGCRRPFPFWWGQWPQNPPEVVLEIERPIGPEGEIEFVIDTSVAQALHGDKDHRYTVTAEVRDASRRTIVGSGEVLAARKPFRIYSWVHRGYYRQGETVRANFQAFTLDKKPVKGQGVVRLLSIEYDDERQPKETEVGKWDIASNEEGVAELQIKATRAGQFRLSCELTDDAGHTVEGGYIFQVVGEGDDGKEFRFQDIELIPEKQEYAPGEVVRLQVNTDRANSTVMLFVRPANGVYLPPQIVQVKGQSSIVEVAVVKRDMPNFFVEAVTVSGGKVHTDVKEIVVPPESRVLNVEVLPDAQEYRPGAPAKVKLHLTDHTGENFVGSTVVTVYDKAVEYISGGTNISDIKEFFWKWRRRHHPNAMHNLSQRGSHIQKSNEPQMQTLGAFGHLLVEQEGRAELQRGAGRGRANKMMAAKSAPGGAVAETASLAIADEAVGGGFAADASDKDSGQAAAGGGFVEPTVRKNFADTALWTAALTTNDQGIAEVSLEMPESLTTWKVKVWGMGHGTRVGAGEAEVITRKNFLLRLQAPRFFVEKD